MKKLLLTSIIAIAFLSSCGSSATKSHNDSVSVVAPTAPTHGTEVASARYQCPMKCEGEKTYDAPGKCPKCGMDLKELK